MLFEAATKLGGFRKTKVWKLRSIEEVGKCNPYSPGGWNTLYRSTTSSCQRDGIWINRD